MKGISFFGNTDMGCVRKNNEDTFVVQNIWDDGHLLAVVVDGVGGYEGGEVAAAIARDTIVEYLEKYPNGERLELLKQAVISANDKVLEGKSKSEELSGMSCVLTAVLVEVADLRVNMVHVGDTRLYQYAYGKLRKLSHDQSVVGYLEDNGLISEEEAMLHPQRNVISHYVGSEEFKEEGGEYVETSSFPLVPTSTLMLCSDGLSDLVPSDRISSVLSMPVSPEEKVKILIEDAKSAGGKDNVTVIVVDAAIAPIDDPVTDVKDEDASEDVEDQSDVAGTPVENLKAHSITVPDDKKPAFPYLWVVGAFLMGMLAGFALSYLFVAGDEVPAGEEQKSAVLPKAEGGDKVEDATVPVEPVANDSIRNDSIASDSISLQSVNNEPDPSAKKK